MNLLYLPFAERAIPDYPFFTLSCRLRCVEKVPCCMVQFRTVALARKFDLRSELLIRHALPPKSESVNPFRTSNK